MTVSWIQGYGYVLGKNGYSNMNLEESILTREVKTQPRAAFSVFAAGKTLDCRWIQLVLERRNNICILICAFIDLFRVFFLPKPIIKDDIDNFDRP